MGALCELKFENYSNLGEFQAIKIYFTVIPRFPCILGKGKMHGRGISGEAVNRGLVDINLHIKQNSC